MKKKTPFPLYIFLALLICLALLALMGKAVNIPDFFKTPEKLLSSLLWPVLRLTVFISIGLLVAQLIEGMGWTSRLAVMARPLMRWGHLNNEMGAVFTTAFFSGTSALSMLSSFHQDGHINRKQMVSAVLLNTFPTFFLHLPTTFFIILPLVGIAGLIYLFLTFSAALLRLGVILVCTRFLFPEFRLEEIKDAPGKHARGKILREITKKFKSRLGRILMIVIPVYIVVALISDMGFFLWLRETFAHGMVSNFIPHEAMSIVIFSLVAEFTSGYAAAGALMKAGALNITQTVFALLLGNIVAAPVRALRHQLPYYMGIFKAGTGIYLILLSQAFRLLSLITVGAIFVFLTVFII